MALTPKQEAFVRAYVETGNATEAYRSAYNTEKMKPASINRCAVRELDKVKIRSRLAELQGKAAARHDVTVDRLTRELYENRAAAFEHNQIGAANAAVLGVAKLHGLVEDKSKTQVEGTVRLQVVTGVPRNPIDAA